MFDGGEYTLEMEEPFPCSTTRAKNKSKNKNKRRFSDEQIRSLETIFEFESRLEPRKKMQVAKDLGLYPRQVAIWFQNKRARRKSKQLERDYTTLQANYKNLASKLETLKKEKQALASLLQKLKEEDQCCGGTNNIDGEYSDKGEAAKSDCEEQQPSYSMERSEHAVGGLSDDDSGIIMTSYFSVVEDEKPHLLSMVEPAGGGDGALTSPEDWHSFDSDALFDDHSGSGYHWWDFWS